MSKTPWFKVGLCCHSDSFFGFSGECSFFGTEAMISSLHKTSIWCKSRVCCSIAENRDFGLVWLNTLCKANIIDFYLNHVSQDCDFASHLRFILGGTIPTLFTMFYHSKIWSVKDFPDSEPVCCTKASDVWKPVSFQKFSQPDAQEVNASSWISRWQKS